MGARGEPQRARNQVAAYHEACLTELVNRVSATLDQYRAGRVDAYQVDETIHQYHRAACELWKFCWAGGREHLEMVASLIVDRTSRGTAPDWWERGAPRRR